MGERDTHEKLNKLKCLLAHTADMISKKVSHDSDIMFTRV